MTAHSDLAAISLTANAQAKAQAAGVNLPALVAQAQAHIADLQILLKQIVAFHPTTGGDASNYSALLAVLAELA